MSNIQQKLNNLGINLPNPISPVANYVGFTINENLVFISGQLPIENNEVKYIGKVGEDITIEQAKNATKICVINILSQLQLACNGNLDLVEKCVKLGVFVNATPNFSDHPVVANGASDFIVEVFGEAGKHARAAVGCGSLPRGVSVEVDAIFSIKKN